MLVGFARYSQDASFDVLGRHKKSVPIMAIGSLVGTFIGGQLLGFTPSALLLPILAAVQIISAVKVWRHR